MRKIQICLICYVVNDTLYISYFSGVYRYNPDRNVLEQIIKGEDYPKFNNMFGNFVINSKEEIFILGFYGGGNDEGPIDFLYMKPKKKSNK